jgi:RNA polymerase sigma factor (TIGR02999 family)
MLLGLASQGDSAAQEQLFRLVEGDLRKLAKARLRHERFSPDLQTTVLVDDAFVRLVGNQTLTWESRAQFYCFAAKIMRQILVDDARRRDAQKRGGDRTAPLDEVPEPIDWQPLEPATLLALHEAMDKLATSQPDLIQIVELRFFAGYELAQIAEDILHLSYPTVKRRWQRARALLLREISGDEHDTGARAPRP